MIENKKSRPTAFLSQLKASKLFVAFSTGLKSRWGKRALLLITIISLWAARATLIDFFGFILDKDKILPLIYSLGLFGPLLMWVLNFLQVIIAVIPGHLHGLAAGYLYGTYFGYFLLYTSTIVAGQIAFLLARRYGRPLVVRFVPAKSLDRWDGSSDQYGVTFYFIGLLIPIFPTDILTFVAGLSTITTTQFTIANLIGRAPYLFLLAYVGDHGVEFLTQGFSLTAWIIIILVITALVVIWRFLLPRVTKKIFGGTEIT